MDGYQRRKHEKMKCVLMTTFDLMNSGTSLYDFTMEDVSHQSNVSKATIFKYFNSKEGLINSVFDHYFRELNDSVSEIVDAHLSFNQSFREISRIKMLFLSKVNHEFYRDLMAYVLTNIETHQEIADQSLQTMMNLFRQGRDEGSIDIKYSDHYLLLYMQAMLEGFSNPYIYNQIVPYLDDYVDMLLKSLHP